MLINLSKFKSKLFELYFLITYFFRKGIFFLTKIIFISFIIVCNFNLLIFFYDKYLTTYFYVSLLKSK